METMSQSLGRIDNQKPFRQGLGLSSLEALSELEGDILRMARAFVEKEAPYLERTMVFVEFHVNNHLALMSVEFAIFGHLDMKLFGTVFTRFGALKKISSEAVIYSDGALLNSRPSDKSFSPILTLMVDDEELMAAGVKTPELYRNQIIDVLKTSYSFLLGQLEQKAFDMINSKIK